MAEQLTFKKYSELEEGEVTQVIGLDANNNLIKGTYSGGGGGSTEEPTKLYIPSSVITGNTVATTNPIFLVGDSTNPDEVITIADVVTALENGANFEFYVFDDSSESAA